MTSAYTTIEIYCDDPSHPGTRWLVDRFANMGPGDWVCVSELPGAEPIWRPRDARTLLDTATNADLSVPFSPPVTVRVRYKFQCRKCMRRRGRESTTLAREQQLAKIFDTLIANGKESISLAELSARLRRSAGS
jgi:hypothetical protein